MTRPFLSVFLAGVTLALTMAAGSSQDYRRLRGAILIDGSSTVYPITEAVAEEFSSEAPRVKTTVGISGTGGGFKRFAAGETDVSNASRAIKKKEVDACTKSGVELIEIPVAYDGLTIVLNKANDWVDHLTVDELKKIYLLSRFRGSGIALLEGKVQGRQPTCVGDACASAMLEQQLYDIIAPEHRCKHQRRTAIAVLDIQSCPAADQDTGDSSMPLEARTHQGCISPVVCEVGIGARVKQCCHGTGLVVIDCNDQWRKALFIAYIDVVQHGKYFLQHRHIALPCCRE